MCSLFLNIQILLKICLPYPLSTTLQGPTVTDNSSDIESRCNYQVNASVNLHFFTLVISQTNAKVNWEPMIKTYIIVANNYQTLQVAIRFEFLAAITNTWIFFPVFFFEQRSKLQKQELTLFCLCHKINENKIIKTKLKQKLMA